MSIQWLITIFAYAADKAFHYKLRYEVRLLWVILLAELDDFTHRLRLPAGPIAAEVGCLEERGHEIIVSCQRLELVCVVLANLGVFDLG